MDWESEGFSLKKKASLPILLDSSSIDAEVNARRSQADELVPGGELENPVKVIEEYFPHILARVVEFWGRDKDFDDYMESVLLIDRRERQGLPRPVLNSLMDVWNDHRVRNKGQIEDKWCWNENTHLHKAFKKLEQENNFVRRLGLSGAEAALLDRQLTETANIKSAKEALMTSGRPMKLGQGPIDLF